MRYQTTFSKKTVCAAAVPSAAKADGALGRAKALLTDGIKL